MPDTIREQIITALAARAAVLSGRAVERAQRSMDESNQIFVSIWDGEDQLQEVKYGVEKLQFPLAVECIWKAGNANASIAANELMGEVVSAMIGPDTDRSFGGLVDQIVASTKSPQYPVDGSDYTTLTVIFLVNYTTAAGNPYART
jgi:hypothetical protein